MLQAIILSYEGVLVNEDAFTKYSIDRACERLGVPFDQATFEQYFRGKNLRIAASNFLTLVHKSDRLNDFLALKEMHEAEYTLQVEVHQEALFFVDRIKNDFSFGIVGDARHDLIRELVKSIHREYIFSVIVGGEEYKGRKPMSDGYEYAIQKLEVPAGNVLIVESTPSGVIAAKTAGAKVLAIVQDYSADDLVNADMVISHFDEATKEAIEKLF